jgi:hypothetical protein
MVAVRHAHEQGLGEAWPSAVRSRPKEAADGHPLLGLQRSVGNAAVHQFIVQRVDDDESAAGGAALGFDPDAIVSDMASGAVSGGGGPAPSEEEGDPVQAQRAAPVAVQRDPPPGGTDRADSTRAASTGDLMKALAAWGPFKQGLDAFKAEVDKSVKQTTGGKATPRSVAFTIAGLGAAVGTGQPIPIKPYLSVTLDPIGKTGMLTLDVGKLARIPGFEGGPFPASGPPGDPFGPGRF